MVALKEASVSARVGALAKPVGQPCAGRPHARLEEVAPVGQPHEDTQAPSTERDGNSYGLAKARSDRALLYILPEIRSSAGSTPSAHTH